KICGGVTETEERAADLMAVAAGLQMEVAVGFGLILDVDDLELQRASVGAGPVDALTFLQTQQRDTYRRQYGNGAFGAGLVRVDQGKHHLAAAGLVDEAYA